MSASFKPIFAVLLVALLAIACPAINAAEPNPPDNQTPPAPKLKITETSLGKIVEGIIPETLTANPDSKRVAYAAQRGET